MRILIIEDEEFVAQRLVQLLDQLEIEHEVCAIIGSVKASIEWLNNNQHPDVILADIQLSDGSSFSIFKEVDIKSKVIFTTSYDDFALDAFKVNSIDYLLKPITARKLKSAFDKLNLMRESFETERDYDVSNKHDVETLLSYISNQDKKYKSRFLIKVGNIYKSIKSEDIAYFYVNNKTTYLMTKDKRKYSLDTPLDELDGILSPETFFRINRQMIINIASIKEIHTFFNSRLLLSVDPEFDDDVIVTRSNISDFKNWMNS